MSNQHQTLCTCGCCEEATDITPLPLENIPSLPALRYRVGTHNSFKESMLKRISSNADLAKKLTSRYDNDMAIAGIDAWATVLDVLSFYQERIINEGFLRTATERLSIIELARHISYKPGTGVAAETLLAFNMNEAEGAPKKALVPTGTKVQSIPEEDELPQVFETIEQIEARVEWNGIKVETKRKFIPVLGDKKIYLKGINTGLQPGDGILMIGDERIEDKTNERWDFRKIKTITTNIEQDYTKITWEKGLGKFNRNVQILPASTNFKVYALRQRAFLFGHNASDWRSLSTQVRNRFLSDTEPPSDIDNNHTAEWADLTINTISSPATETIHLDNIYSKIVKDSWLVLFKNDYDEVYRVENAVESSRKGFTLTSKTTAVKIDGENLSFFNSNIRDAVVYAQSEELEIAEMPVDDFLKNEKEITLEKLTAGLPAEKNIILSGKRNRIKILESANYPRFVVPDDPIASRTLVAGDSLVILKKPDQMPMGRTKWALADNAGFEGSIEVLDHQFKIVASVKEDKLVSEPHIIISLKPATNPTVIILKKNVANLFDPATVLVRANVAAATHGETRQETLGSGNGSQMFQKFGLKQKPLTFISADSSTGTKTTLQIRVNDILWKEVDSLYNISPKEKVYTTIMSDSGAVTVIFGDGITGSRLPTGVENIKATYRVGIGSAGLLNAEQLSMLMTPRLGVNKVINPLPSSGAADPEDRDEARKNAPLTVLTLDRIISAKDFEDFTRAFAGVGKAKADILWKEDRQVVYITVAGADQRPVNKDSNLYKNLKNAIKNSGHSNNAVYVENFEPLFFTVDAKVFIDSNYDFEKVKKNIVQALKDTFSFDAREFGQSVTPAEVITVIQKVEAVIFVDLEQLNGIDAFTEHLRINAGIARRSVTNILPAQLLTINQNEINITQTTL